MGKNEGSGLIGPYAVARDELPESLGKTDILESRKRRKGRTGWPEAVWAMELESNTLRSRVQIEEPVFEIRQSNNNNFANMMYTNNSNAIGDMFNTRFSVPTFVQDHDYLNRDDWYTSPQKYQLFIGNNGKDHQQENEMFTYDISSQINVAQSSQPVYFFNETNENFPILESTNPILTAPRQPAKARLPSIPHFLHRTVDSPISDRIPGFIPSTALYSHSTENSPLQSGFPNFANTEFPNCDSCLNEPTAVDCYSAPELTELKTVSMASIKISTSTINGNYLQYG